MFTTSLCLVCCLSLVISTATDLKDSEKNVDGKQYTLKSVGTTYTQRVSNHGQCTVELNGNGGKQNILTEGEIIKIKNKWFKAEDCRLNRAYMVSCGSQLLRQILNIVCSYAEQSYDSNKVSKRQQTEDGLINIIDKSYYRECCNSACTVSELIQYCPLNS
ncbi:unnamed protein product [Rotaria socialis]|uniref:Uncharacterized protein n=1 Tax=Rotaria socialis TaxID=392032 RepID=A0A820X1I5_9BILA|nr:unnamed protein product [Rotaria socialis]CAF3369513.1 unnamed protein product [Rotaria socialis]CAF3421245.1 unnamed protein product [Rotaria socialis]CAF3503902.1 unnamed protein product [Rotaria socialis]CAF3755229.1 unnamed protein product [Rotaria socialis]